jgi:hypothetical protein
VSALAREVEPAMAQTETRRSSAESAVRVLEQGNIYFLYRPKVNQDAAHDFRDVQRLYIVLKPHGKRVFRLLIIGEKRLPSVTPRGDRKSWGFVDNVGTRVEEIEDELDPKAYFTKTRGERLRPAARPAGEGVYALLRHEDHTHLVYALELPAKPGEVQHAFNIVEEGSYIISVKNPEAPSPPGMGLDDRRQADFPRALRERFQNRRFIDVDPPDFLDYEGAEILLIGASHDVHEELGLRLHAERETEATAEIFRELRLEKALHPIAPLLKGEWA